jgi:hypothetical protein
MRRILLLFALLLPLAVRAQQPIVASAAKPDVLLRTDGEELPGKVLLITPDVIRLFPLAAGGTLSADTLTLPRADVFMIRFADGRKQVLQEASTALALPQTAAEIKALGKADARKHYRGNRAFWGTYGTTVVLVPLAGAGLVAGAGTATALALTPPKTKNLTPPNPELLQDPTYDQAYRREALRKKGGSAFGGFAAGVGTWVVAGVIIIAATLGR